MTDEQPTNQFPSTAPDADQPADPAAGPPAEPTPTRRSRRGPIVAIVAAVIVLGGGIGVAVAMGTDGGDVALPPGAPSSTTAGSPGAGSAGATAGSRGGKKAGKKAGKNGKNTVIRGTIVTESGSTWTVKTVKGKTTTVAIDTNTRFGTKAAPAKATDFPVGHKVAIAGVPATGSNGTFTARRVRTPVAKGQGKAGGSATPTPTPSPSSS